jgi:hypothetical protein
VPRGAPDGTLLGKLRNHGHQTPGRLPGTIVRARHCTTEYSHGTDTVLSTMGMSSVRVAQCAALVCFALQCDAMRCDFRCDFRCDAMRLSMRCRAVTVGSVSAERCGLSASQTAHQRQLVMGCASLQVLVTELQEDKTYLLVGSDLFTGAPTAPSALCSSLPH